MRNQAPEPNELTNNSPSVKNPTNIPKFGGKPHEKLRNWIAQFEISMEDCGVQEDAAKIKKMILYLEGDALDWYVDLHLDGKLNIPFNELIGEMKRKFTSESITLVRMVNGDLKGYVEKFESYVAEFSIKDEQMKIKHFLRGVQDPYFDKLCGRTFNTFKEMKDLINLLLERMPVDNSPTLNVYRANQEPTIRKVFPSNEWDDKKTRLYQEGRCFRCEQVGHTNRNCPNKFRRYDDHPKPSHLNANGRQ